MVRKKLVAAQFSRRLALQQLCLAPAGVMAARWLSGCASDRPNPIAPGGDDDDDTRDDDSASMDDDDSNEGVDAGSKPGTTTADAASSKADARAASNDAASTGNEPKRDAAGSANAEDADVGGSSDASAADASSATADASSANVPWASGGTKSMKGNYPDPFAGGMMGAACALYPAQTLGPCYSSPVMAREDISDGMTGLPLRLSFLVVRQDGCTPVPDAEVDIWHTGSNGVYSAFASGTCNPDRINVASMRYCRGKQTTNAQGRVDFSTIFPGWYTGRTIHIHFTVRAGGREFITSQLYFEDTLNDEIMEQVDYKARGKRDTVNSRDSILRGTSNLSPVLFSHTKRPDGVLHAWKVLSIRS